MSNKKKSSVQWAIDELTKLNVLWHLKEIGSETYNRFYNEIIKNYTKMHEEEIKEAYTQGCYNQVKSFNGVELKTPIEYYRETFEGGETK